MKIVRREKDGVSILDLEGNININSSDFIEAVGWILRNRRGGIICNMKGINLVDYIGISVLAIIYKNVLNHKRKIKFYGVPAHVKKLFSIVGIDKALECFDTEDQALNSFNEDKVIAKIVKKKLRRRFERVAFNNNIEYKRKFSHHSNVLYRGKILNISAVGAFVISEKIFSIGEILFVRLYLMPKPGIIETEAKVIWNSTNDVSPLEYPAMGIEFYNIDGQKQKTIIEFVENHAASGS